MLSARDALKIITWHVQRSCHLLTEQARTRRTMHTRNWCNGCVSFNEGMHQHWPAPVTTRTCQAGKDFSFVIHCLCFALCGIDVKKISNSSVTFSFPLWSPVTSSEFSHNRCYRLRSRSELDITLLVWFKTCKLDTCKSTLVGVDFRSQATKAMKFFTQIKFHRRLCETSNSNWSHKEMVQWNRKYSQFFSLNRQHHFLKLMFQA